MAPRHTFFASWSAKATHVVGTTCNDRWTLRSTFGWMGDLSLQVPQQFHGRVLMEVKGARPLEAPKNLHLTVPKSGSNIAQQYVDAYAFFQFKVKGKSQRSKIFNSQVSYQKK